MPSTASVAISDGFRALHRPLSRQLVHRPVALVTFLRKEALHDADAALHIQENRGPRSPLPGLRLFPGGSPGAQPDDLDLRGAPLFDEDGGFEGYRGIGRDVLADDVQVR